MAFPTAVNGQIIDAVTHGSIEESADSQVYSPGSLYQATAQALADAANNAAIVQQQSAVSAPGGALLFLPRHGGGPLPD